MLILMRRCCRDDDGFIFKRGRVMIAAGFYETKVMSGMSNKTIELRIMTEHPLHGVAKGNTVTVSVDRDGTPLDKNWRRRLKDSKIDGCVEIVTKAKPKSEPTIKATEKKETK